MTRPAQTIGGQPRPPLVSLRRAVRSPGLWSILFVIVVAWVTYAQLRASGGAIALREQVGSIALLPLILLHGLVSVSPLPGEAVAFANSMVFGFPLGLVSNWSGWMLAALLQYWLVRRTTNDLQLRHSTLWRRAPRWLQKIPVEHPLFLIGARWLPFGGHLVNTAAGAAAVPLWRHTWCAAISILPVAILVAALGSSAAKAFSQ